MSLFEFLMVLVSIIIGLGIVTVLTGVAQMIRYRDSAQPYWVHVVAVCAVFLALLQQWWEIWFLRVEPEWNFIALLMMLVGPIGLFLITHLISPEPVQGANLRRYYQEEIRPVWFVAALTVIIATLFRPLIFDYPLLIADNATSAVLLVIFVILAVTRRQVVHAVLVPLLFLMILLDVVQWTFVIWQPES